MTVLSPSGWSSGANIRRGFRVLVLVAILSVLTACGTAPPMVGSAPASTQDPKLEKRLHWIVEKLNAREKLTLDELVPGLDAERFSSEDTAGLLQYLNSVIRPQGPFAVVHYRQVAGDSSGLVASLRSRWGVITDLIFTLSDREKLASWMFKASDSVPDSAESLEEVKQRLLNISPHLSLLVQRSRSGKVVTDIGVDAADSKPMASLFKLYVLGAVVREISEARLSWGHALTVREEIKSPGTGTLRDAPDGAEVSVLDAAKRMIDVSDNTAADMLMQIVGSEALASAVRDLGHHDPKALDPFLSSREMFALAVGEANDAAAGWADYDREAKRAIIASIDSSPIELDQLSTDQAFWPRGLDWFANAEDISAALRQLGSMISEHPELREVLQLTSASDPAIDELGIHVYKAGTAPGVFSSAFMAELRDGTVVTAVAQIAVNDNGVSLDLQRDVATSLVADALRISGNRGAPG
ncbi:serine hydrolase [Leifsonia sp. NCR5]|uniref:serine hydrolase n=1 Tax=Leifsonia sp. NCR5 TaxID=1978342 RepID=UPI00117BC519|nr:serine hydrolase [Leifsonia sp. NCR5]